MHIIKDLTTQNYNSGNNPQWIVIHYTANNGDTAKGNCNYFKEYRGASANYFVDEKEIRCCVEPWNAAWHCGDNYSRNGCTNYNSIGIELCSRKDSNGQYYFMPNTVSNAVELTKWLMQQYNIPIERVCRHYDVTHKNCPEPFVRDSKQWEDFKGRLIDDMTEEQVKQICNDMIYKYNKKQTDDLLEVIHKETDTVIRTLSQKTYNTFDDVPEWGKDVIKKLVEKGIIQGTDKGFNISNDLLRILVILDRLQLI